jgi:hypothetical protein
MTRYRHHKGSIYQWLGNARSAGPIKGIFVVYRSLETSTLYIRPFDEFFGHLPDGQRRFTPVDEHDDTVNVIGDTVAATNRPTQARPPRAQTHGDGRASANTIRRK